jgi:hypothetical protein
MIRSSPPSADPTCTIIVATRNRRRNRHARRHGAAAPRAINQEKHLDIDQAWRFVTGGGLITEVTAYWCQAQLYRRLAVKRYDQITIA